MRAYHLSLLGLFALGSSIYLSGCGGTGKARNTIESIAGLKTSSIAGPINPAQVRMTAFVPRNIYGRANSPTNLAFPGLNGEEMRHFMRGMQLFITDFTPQQGLGPVFNQRTCLGCHQATAGFGLVPTAVARAQRGSAFTVFGDFSPAAGTFIPLTEFGGPFLRERSVNGAPLQEMPPESADPFILNAGMVRAVGLRAAPPYIGRGLMEAVPNNEIAKYDDPFDADGDGVSGRHNENHDDIAFVGGSPVNRLARFGVKGGGPTLLQFMLGGLCFQIGMTTPFCPTDSIPPNVAAAGNFDPAPDPELTEQDVFDLRTFIRLIAPPAIAPLSPAAQRGARLFGVRLDVTGQPTPGDTITTAATGTIPAPLGPGRGDGIDPNPPAGAPRCVSCHVPFMTTGRSPAEIGRRHLSNRTFPIFSDLLLHDMGANLADNVRIASVTGLATSREWRTPPLMGVGLTGPPFFHDARVGSGLSQDEALRQAIELHDNYGADSDSEAHNSIQAFRRLSPDNQQAIIEFLKAL